MKVGTGYDDERMSMYKLKLSQIDRYQHIEGSDDHNYSYMIGRCTDTINYRSATVTIAEAQIAVGYDNKRGHWDK